MNYFKDDLKDLQSKLFRSRKLNSILERMYNQRKDLKLRVEELNKIRLDEQEDVKNLENGNLVSFFYNVVGKKDEKLNEERAEAYKAKVKYDAEVNDLESLNKDINTYEIKLKSLEEIEDIYKNKFNERVEFVKTENNEKSVEVYELEKRLHEIDTQHNEIEEAINEGEKALNVISNIKKYLSSADGLAMWDMLGGGSIISYMKRSKMDEAQKEFEVLQMQLRKFKTELADVTIDEEYDVDLSGYMTLIDVFFDNFFVDIMVKNKINESMKQVSDIEHKVNEAISKLNNIKEEMQEDKINVEANIAELVSQY